MQVMSQQIAFGTRQDDLAPEETRNIPFFGFIMGTAASLALWAVIAWAVWAVVD